MNPRIAMFPGSFDPPTLGHDNIIRRAAKLYDKLYVVVATNSEKHYLFSNEEREEMMKSLFKDINNIEVVHFDGLVVDFAKKYDVGVLLRGVRAFGDFGYEFELAMTNKKLLPSLEILFLPTDPNYFILRSSQIKELASYGADVSNMVPKVVIDKLNEKNLQNKH